MGRNVLCIPLRYGEDPYGILGRYQGLTASKDARDVAKDIFHLLCSKEITHEKYISTLSNLFLNSSSEETASKWLNLIKEADNLSESEVFYIRTHLSDSSVLVNFEGIVTQANELFRNYGIKEFKKATTRFVDNVNDLPF